MTDQSTFETNLSRYIEETEQILKSYLEDVPGANQQVLTTVEAMRYALESGGKRLRPILMRLTFELFHGENRKVLHHFMAAIEMIHTYSLVHDDLPAMDNDDLRRGRKTTHVVYGEAVGVLAGDGLLNQAYETALAATEYCADAEEMLQVLLALRMLAMKAGVRGMIGGQCEDIRSEKTPPADPRQTLIFIHKNKTAALFEAALMCGAILAHAPEETVDLMELTGSLLGYGFQIQDDVLDEIGEESTLGKHTGKDQDQGKLTWTSLYGVERAKQDADTFLEQAKELVLSCGAEPDSFFIALLDSLRTRNH